jgi:hypothetical protein
VLANQIQAPSGSILTPPDFYTYYEGTAIGGGGFSVEYDDFIHPKGNGLQSMADLWNEAIVNP